MPIMKKATILLAIVSTIVLGGCGQKSPPPTSQADGRAYVDAIKGMPADQRQSYIRTHPDGIKAVMNSRDQNLIGEFRGAIRGGR